MFNSEREAEITQRRIAFINRIAATEGTGRPLSLLVGEVKEIASARFGHRVVIRRLPKPPLASVVLSQDGV